MKRDASVHKGQPYSIKSVEGHTYLTKHGVVNADEITAGDRVAILTLPGGQFYLNKTDAEDASVVERVTLSHIFFEGSITMEDTDELHEEG
jgi:hypothetical protein